MLKRTACSKAQRIARSSFHVMDLANAKQNYVPPCCELAQISQLLNSEGLSQMLKATAVSGDQNPQQD
eukprot:6211424-Pleurochrysis_carterae.AAC.6